MSYPLANTRMIQYFKVEGGIPEQSTLNHPTRLFDPVCDLAGNFSV